MTIKRFRGVAGTLIAALIISVFFGLTASAANAADFTVTITGGTVVSCTPEDGTPVTPEGASPYSLPAGASVSIQADAPEAGKVFTGWVITAPETDPPVLTPSGDTPGNATFTMPSTDVTLTAAFAYPSVSITGGTVVSYTPATEGGVPTTPSEGATSPYSLPVGASVSIQANTPEVGKVFTGWVTDPVALLSEHAPGNATFTMPSTNVTLTAALKDAATLTLTIQDATLNDDSVQSLPYSGNPVVAAVTFKDATDAAIDALSADNCNFVYTGRGSTAYTPAVSSTPPTDAGDYTLTVSVKPDHTTYAGTASLDFSITPFALDGDDIVLTALTYNGSEQTVSASLSPALTHPEHTDLFVITNGSTTDVGTYDGENAATIRLKGDGTTEGGVTAYGNYTMPDTGIQKSYTISPYPVSLVWSGNEPRAYTGTASAVTAAISDTTPLLGDDVCAVNVSGGDAVFAGNTHKATASLTNSNYMIKSGEEEKTYSITSAVITLGMATLADKPYDGTVTGTLGNITFSGLLGSDALSLSQNDFTATVTFPQANAGNSLTATVSITLGDTPLAKSYTFMASEPASPVKTAETTATGKIIAKPIAGTLKITLTTDTNGNGAADYADVLTAAYAATDATGAQPAASDLLYQWKRGGGSIPGATAATYALTADDAGKLITCAVTAKNNFSGTIENTTGIASATLPLPGTVSISGNTTLGQTLTASLSSGIATTHYVWKWYRGATEIQANGLNTHLIGADDLGETLSAKAISVTGTGAVYSGEATGHLLIPAAAPAQPTIDLASDIGKLSIAWNTPDDRGTALLGYLLVVKRAGTEIKGSPFTLSYDKTSLELTDLTGGANYSATLTAINSAGRTDSNTPSIMVRAPYSDSTPSAPTRYSRSTSSITLTPHNGYEYSMDGSSWQDSNTFSNLKAGTSYTFYQRVKETTSHDHSDTSPKYTTSTRSSSSDSSSSGDDDTTTNTNTNTSTNPTTTADKLYELTVTEANTNVLYSTMNKLISGNAEQAVTITLPRVTYTFAKGTMTAITGKVWYDLGVAIDNCVHTSSIQSLAGDAHVLTLHFNYDGTLPGEATVRIFLGTQYTGQTLYYYKWDEAANSLVFQQNTTVDASGWASVQQKECSDYALLNRDISTAAATPEPSASPSPSPAPTATGLPIELTADPKPNKFDWQLAGIIGGAALVLLGIVWLSLKRRGSDEDEDDTDF